MPAREDGVERQNAADNSERRGRRVSVSCRVFFFGDEDYEGEGRLVDVSTSGCRISSQEALLAGIQLKLSLFLKDHQWPVRIEQAIVWWAREGTCGMRDRWRIVNEETADSGFSAWAYNKLIMKENPADLRL
jgi:hypothetical protein